MEREGGKGREKGGREGEGTEERENEIRVCHIPCNFLGKFGGEKIKRNMLRRRFLPLASDECTCKKEEDKRIRGKRNEGKVR